MSEDEEENSLIELAAPRSTVGAGTAPRPRRRLLTERQRACTLLVATGKTDEEIAEVLGISKLTAHKHIEGAKRRYGVTTRVRLVVEALFNNELTFEAIFAEEL